MVVSVIIVILGALLIAASVLLRPKMPPKVANIVLIVAICVILIGGILLYFAWDQAKEDACNVYMALRYLEQDQGDASWYYLRRTPSDSFDSIAAGVAMENARGNTGEAKDKLHDLEDRAHLGQRDTVKQLQALLDGEQTLKDTATYLLEHIDLSKSLQQEMDRRFAIETGIAVGDVDLSALSDTLTLEQQVNTALTQKKYREAVEKAVELVDHKASAHNRLLLAECVAEALYQGDYLDGAVFDPAASAEDIANGTAAKERAELKKDIDSLSEQVNTAWDDLEKLTDDASKQRAQGKLDVLLEQLEEAQNAYNYLFGRRALTSIANIHSVEADVVRARLYFAMNQKDKAMDVLQETAGSLGVTLSFDGAMKEQFKTLKEAYEDKDPDDVRNQEFQDLMRTLLSPGALDTVGVIAGPITADMVQYIVRDAVAAQ